MKKLLIMPENRYRTSNFRILALLLYAAPAALACWLYFITTEHSPHFLSALPRSDAFFYLYNAWFTAFVDPEGGVTHKLIPTSLYTEYLKSYFQIFGFNNASAYTANSLLLASSASLLSSCARILFDSRTAIWCSILIGLCGPLLFFTGTTMKTIFVVFTLSLFLLFLCLYFRTKHAAWLLPSCLMISLCSIDRHNAIVLFAPLALLAFFYGVRISKAHWLALVGSVTLSIFALGVLVDWHVDEIEPEFNAPLGLNFYVGNNGRSTGGYTSVHGISDDLYGHRIEIVPFTESKLQRELTKDEISGYWFQQSFNFIKESPKEYALLQLKKLILLTSQYTYGSPEQFAAWRWSNPVLSLAFVDYSILLALCILVLFALRPAPLAIGALLLGCFAIYAASIWVFFVTERYKLPLYVFLIPLAAYGIERFITLDRKTKWKAVFVFSGTLVLSMLGNKVMEPGYGWPSNHHTYRTELKESARKLSPFYQAMIGISSDQANPQHYVTLASRLRTPFYRPDSIKIIEKGLEMYPTDTAVLELALKSATSGNNYQMLNRVRANLMNIDVLSHEQERLYNSLKTYDRRRQVIQQ